MQESPTLTWDQFKAVDIRVGRVRNAREFPEARNPSYILEIDFGEAIGVKKTSAQITDYYQPAELVDKQVLAVVNFPPKQIGPIMSEVLVLGAVEKDGKVVLLQLERQTDLGLRVS